MENQFDKINLEDLFFKTLRYLMAGTLSIASLIVIASLVKRHFTGDHFSLLLATFTGEEKISPELLKKKFDTILST